MRRLLISLSVLLLLQLALALLLSERRNPLSSARIDAPLIASGLVQSADRLIIESKASAVAAAALPAGPDRIELKKKDGAWVLPGQFDAPADGARVNALLGRLAALKRGLPIATSEAALKRFKLLDGDFERRVVLTAGDKTLDTLYFGSSAGLRKSDARGGADRAVYAVDLATYELPTDTAAWLDAGLLRQDVATLSELDVTGENNQKIELQKQAAADSKLPASWTAPALLAGQHIDSAHADSLVEQLSDLRVDSVLGTELKPEWQQEHPALKLEIRDAQSHSVDWTLSKPAAGDYYVLKSSSHPWYFSISAAAAKSLISAGGRDQLIVSAKPDKPAAGHS